MYDTVSNASWSVDIRTHGIVNLIERLLNDQWPPSVEIGREVPEPKSEDDCVVSVSCLIYLLRALTKLLGMLQLGIRRLSGMKRLAHRLYRNIY